MAFNKDSAVRASVQQNAFRSRTWLQASKALTKNRFPSSGGGGKGGLPYWIDQYKPPIGYDSVIRVLLGNFKQSELIEVGTDVQVIETDSAFVKFVEHFDGARERSSICSAGPLAHYRDKRDPCLGCDIYWSTAARNSAGKFESSRMSKQNKFAFAIFDYGTYHKVPTIDRSTGQQKTGRDGKPFFDWKPCLGRGCSYCKSGFETKVGHSTHWSLGYSQFQLIRDAARQIGRSCTVCSGVDCVDSLGWMCESCGECIIEMSTTELKPQEIVEKTEEVQTCPYCAHVGCLDEVYECQQCSQRGQTGNRASLFDVDLTLTLQPLQSNKTQLIIRGWSIPYPIAPEFAEAAKPIDLSKRYRPDTMEKQAEQFGVAATQQPPAAGAPAGVYGGGHPQVPYRNPNKPA